MLKQTKSKKGVSIMIGYVLLIAIAIVMGGAMYAWMVSYVPSDEDIECPDGTAILIKSFEHSCTTPEVMNVTIKNTGRFDVAGYFIKATNDSTQTIATIDLTKYLIITDYVYSFGGAVLFSPGDNSSFKPNNNSILPGWEIDASFNLTSDLGEITSLEIVPVRWQKEQNKLRFLSCGEDSKTKESTGC